MQAECRLSPAQVDVAARRRGERLRQERQESGGSGRVLLLRLAEGSAQKRWLKAYGRRAAPSRGESSGWSGFIRGSRARALQTMSCVWRVACTERRGLADIVVDVVRRPSGARGAIRLEQRFISAIARDTYGRDARLPEVVTVICTCINGKL